MLPGTGRREVDTQGDAFFVAFAKASQAVAATVAAMASSRPRPSRATWRRAGSDSPAIDGKGSMCRTSSLTEKRASPATNGPWAAMISHQGSRQAEPLILLEGRRAGPPV